MRRAVLAVIGQGGVLSAQVEELAYEVGQRAMRGGFRLITGGRGGVMAAASRGARESEHWQEGRIVGVLPTYDRTDANPWVDVILPTGLGHARNVLVVSSADVVLAIAGGAGTLSELALAWQLGIPVLALACSGGWAEKLANESLDDRREGCVEEVRDAQEAIEVALGYVRSLHTKTS